jgi:hypothetical protein
MPAKYTCFRHAIPVNPPSPSLPFHSRLSCHPNIFSHLSFQVELKYAERGTETKRHRVALRNTGKTYGALVMSSLSWSTLGGHSFMPWFSNLEDREPSLHLPEQIKGVSQLPSSQIGFHEHIPSVQGLSRAQRNFLFELSP